MGVHHGGPSLTSHALEDGDHRLPNVVIAGYIVLEFIDVYFILPNPWEFIIDRGTAVTRRVNMVEIKWITLRDKSQASLRCIAHTTRALRAISH